MYSWAIQWTKVYSPEFIKQTNIHLQGCQISWRHIIFPYNIHSIISISLQPPSACEHAPHLSTNTQTLQLLNLTWILQIRRKQLQQLLHPHLDNSLPTSNLHPHLDKPLPISHLLLPPPPTLRRSYRLHKEPSWLADYVCDSQASHTHQPATHIANLANPTSVRNLSSSHCQRHWSYLL